MDHGDGILKKATCSGNLSGVGVQFEPPAFPKLAVLSRLTPCLHELLVHFFLPV